LCQSQFIKQKLISIIKIMVYVRTSSNRSVYASPPAGCSGSEKPQSAYGFYAFFLRYILARRNAVLCFIGGPKRRRTEGSQTAGTLCDILAKKYNKNS
jgi:hypothetical protein